MLTCLAWWQALPSTADPLPPSHSGFLEVFEVLFILAGVLLLAYVLLRLGLPRMFGMPGSGTGPIQIVARQSLEPRKTLYLVNVGSQVFLLGTADNQVQYLTVIDEENASAVLSMPKREPVRAKDFRHVLSWFQKTGKADCG
jgi:flagellar biogenesis protein FliO